MSYESPINLILKSATEKLEHDILKAVQTYYIDVNKDELGRALKYDREQYEKGYRDGKNFRHYEGVKPYKDGNRWHCGECSTAIGRFWKYCQYCGQKIGWDEVSDENSKRID